MTPENTFAGRGPSIAIGIDDKPVISFRGSGTQFIHCTNQACGSHDAPTTLDSVSAAWQDQTSLAIGTDGNPIVGYQGSGSVPRVAHCTDAACTSNVTNAIGPTDHFPTSITIGSDGNPIVASLDSSGDAATVVHCTDEACAASPQVTLETGSSFSASVEIGTDLRPVLTFTSDAGVSVAPALGWRELALKEQAGSRRARSCSQESPQDLAPGLWHGAQSR